MSKHIGRKQRWAQESASRYTSDLGRVVYERNGWYGTLDYKTRAPRPSEAELAGWVAQTLRLGPFRRPRDAMVAVEREATVLANRHGKDLLLGGRLWAEAE